ncbi:MAG: L,D-transpeptidase Cds6 family protein [Candidatus Loosdrechtia sp.]|uniref:L,D-transpeptidase Cds6 family protein n=1 Tax=Candidatus Loosdrechtia sp. TaxID=3101272 RepID=UPI00403AFC17
MPPLVVPEDLDAPDRQLALRVPDERRAPGRPGTEPDGCFFLPPAYYASPGEPNPEGLPVRPSAVAAAGGAPRAAPTRVTREVTSFIQDWAAAWDRRDFDGWVRYYEPDFTPEGYDDNAGWREEQQRLFEVDANTQVRTDTVQVSMLPEGRVRVRFEQEFGVGEQTRAVLKELVLAPGPRRGSWLIAEDYVLDIL